MVPFDTRSAFLTSGLRLGTAAITTRGAKEDLMHLIAALIEDVLNHPEDDRVIAQVREKVNATMKNYPLFADEKHRGVCMRSHVNTTLWDAETRKEHTVAPSLF